MNTPKAFRIKHLIKELDEKYKQMSEEYDRDILKVYLSTNDADKCVDSDLPFKVKPGSEAEAKEALTNFGKRKFTLAQPKITSDVIFTGSTTWTPVELSVLDPIVSDIVPV